MPRTTVRNPQISFRALGILTWIMDHPDGWAIRAAQMSTEGPGREGREAIQSGLKELGRVGCYRLERRRLLNGKLVMGTAASEEPVPAWAAQWAGFGGRPVPVVQQRDGSFLVRYPDGSLLPEDAPPPPDAFTATGGAGDGFSGSGTGDGKPGTGEPAPGNTGTGEPAPYKEGQAEEGKEEPPPTPPPPVAVPPEPVPAVTREEEGGSTQQEKPPRLLAAAVLDDILATVATTRRPMGRLRAQILAALAEAIQLGWDPQHLGLVLAGRWDGAGHVGAVLRSRVRDLLEQPPPPPAAGEAPPARREPCTNPECDSHAGGAGMVEHPTGGVSPCPVCRPTRAAAVSGGTGVRL